MQTPEASHISLVPRNQPHLASPMLGLHCTHFLRPQYPSTPHPLFPSRRERRSPSPRCGCHEQQEVNEKQPKPRNSPSHNHDSTAPRQHPLIYTGAGSIHPVHGPLLSPATEAIAPKGFTFLPFWRFFCVCVCVCVCVCACVCVCVCVCMCVCASRRAADTDN